jgi:alpha-mannosidase
MSNHDIGGEGMIYTTDGEPLHGLTGGKWRDRRVEFIIPKEWKAGKQHTFYIETSMNGMFGKSALQFAAGTASDIQP